MTKKEPKSGFIGIKVTREQAALLDRLQEALDSPTKTDILLRGLDLMAKVYLPVFTSPSKIPPHDYYEAPTSIATSLELAKLEADALRYSIIVQQTKTKTKEVIGKVVQELSKTDKIIDKYEADKSALIQVLLELQYEKHWLSEDVLKWVSQKLDVPLSQIYHIATFYKAFSLAPQGRHTISICMGTACQVRGAPLLLDKVTSILRIKPGETSRDMRFSLNTVNCLGCCALGPVMMVDDKYYSNPSTKKIEKIVASCD